MRRCMAVGTNALLKWVKNYRAWLVFVIVAVCVCEFTEPVFEIASRWGFAVTPWIFPFIDSQPFMKMIIYFGIILLFCNAPFLYQDQVYVMVRAGRKAYAIGQLWSMIIVTMAYFFWLMCIPIVTHMGKVGWSTEWGDVLFTAANTDALSQSGGVGTIIISMSIVENLSPIQAVGLSYLFHVLTGVMLGYAVYLGNVLLNGYKWSGVFIAGVLVIIDPIFSMFKYYWSPVSWGYLAKLDFVNNGARLSIKAVIVRLALVIGLLAVGCIIKMRRIELKTVEE